MSWRNSGVFVQVERKKGRASELLRVDLVAVGTRPWAKEIESKTGGRVKVQVFPAMQLGGRPGDLYGQARDGVVDLVWTLPGFSAGRFPLTEVFELPFVAGDAVATSQALTEF